MMHDQCTQCAAIPNRLHMQPIMMKAWDPKCALSVLHVCLHYSLCLMTKHTVSSKCEWQKCGGCRDGVKPRIPLSKHRLLVQNGAVPTMWCLGKSLQHQLASWYGSIFLAAFLHICKSLTSLAQFSGFGNTFMSYHMKLHFVRDMLHTAYTGSGAHTYVTERL